MSESSLGPIASPKHQIEENHNENFDRALQNSTHTGSRNHKLANSKNRTGRTVSDNSKHNKYTGGSSFGSNDFDEVDENTKSFRNKLKQKEQKQKFNTKRKDK